MSNSSLPNTNGKSKKRDTTPDQRATAQLNLLASCLINPSECVPHLGLIPLELFDHGGPREAASAICDLYTANIAVTEDSILQQLIDTSTYFERAGVFLSGLREDHDRPRTSADISFWARSVFPGMPDPSPKWKPFPTGALPSAAREFVREGAAAQDCDESFFALPILAMLAGAVGDTRRIQLKNGWREPCIIWTCVVAETGSGKTPAFDTIMQIPEQREREMWENHQLALEEYEAKRKAVGKEGKSEAPRPIRPRLLIKDITIEALIHKLQENPRGLLVARDELSGWLDSFGRYSGASRSERSIWQELYGGKQAQNDRKSDSGDGVLIPRAVVSLTGGIQPHVLRRALTDEMFQAGLAGRLFMALPPRKAQRWTDDVMGERTWNRLASLFSNLLVNEDRQVLALTDEAQKIWVAYVNEIAKELEQEDDKDVLAAWAKLKGGAARLGLLCALMEDPHVMEVGAEALQSGITLARWFGHEAKRVYMELRDDAVAKRLDGDVADALEVVKESKGRLSPRELHHKKRRFRGHGKAENVLEKLRELGFGRWQTRRGDQGRPVTEFVLYTTLADRRSLVTTVTEVENDSSIADFCDHKARLEGTSVTADEGDGNSGADYSPKMAADWEDPDDNPF